MGRMQRVETYKKSSIERVVCHTPDVDFAVLPATDMHAGIVLILEVIARCRTLVRVKPPLSTYW